MKVYVHGEIKWTKILQLGRNIKDDLQQKTQCRERHREDE